MDESDPSAVPDPQEGTGGSVEADDAESLVGQLVADRYHIEQLLGRGAMGAVYRARHVHMQKDVALKVLHQDTSQNPEVVRRFEREAVAAGRVEHPNVAGATDFGRLKNGAFYLVLEYIRGKSLGRVIEEGAPLETRRAARIALQVASALSAAHAAGIVHRDLKPENVMILGEDPDAEMVKVLDFGMAKLQQADSKETKLTMHGAVYGTPQYMAPEQASGEEVDGRADLYSLGLMLQEMLTGQPPFVAETLMALLVKQMTEKPPPLPLTVPRPLARLVTRLLKKDRASRPQDAEEVVRLLSHFLGMSPSDPRISMGSVHSTTAGAAFSAVAEMKEQVVDRVAQMAPVVSEQVAPFIERGAVASRSVGSFFLQPMTLAGKTFPRWVPAVTAVGFAFALIVLTWESGEEESKEPPAAAAVGEPPTSPGPVDVGRRDTSPPDPELARVITAAELGSDPALYALEQRNDDERSLTEWLGLAKARLMRKQVQGALTAFAAAIEMDASVRFDETMLGALRRVAEDSEHGPLVIDFAADKLDSLGADLLFDIWAKTSLKTQATTLAYEKLTSDAVRNQYSPELKVAMTLRRLEKCEDYKKFMPEVERVGDERTLTKLRQLSKERGCGANKRSDCYPCLRKNDALTDAIQAAAMRKAPRFDMKRFQFKK